MLKPTNGTSVQNSASPLPSNSTADKNASAGGHDWKAKQHNASVEETAHNVLDQPQSSSTAHGPSGALNARNPLAKNSKKVTELSQGIITSNPEKKVAVETPSQEPSQFLKKRGIDGRSNPPRPTPHQPKATDSIGSNQRRAGDNIAYNPGNATGSIRLARPVTEATTSEKKVAGETPSQEPRQFLKKGGIDPRPAPHQPKATDSIGSNRPRATDNIAYNPGNAIAGKTSSKEIEDIHKQETLGSSGATATQRVSAFKYASEELKGDPGIIRAALRQDGTGSSN